MQSQHMNKISNFNKLQILPNSAISNLRIPFHENNFLQTKTIFNSKKILSRILRELWPDICKFYNIPNQENLKISFKVRLVNELFLYLRRNKRRLDYPFLSSGKQTTIKRFQVPESILKNVTKSSHKLVKYSLTHQVYNLYSDLPLIKWIYEHYVPQVSSFCGLYSFPYIQSHIRHYDFERDGSCYSKINQKSLHHLHIDNDAFSFPLIIYLSPVDTTNGAFQYIRQPAIRNNSYIETAVATFLTHDVPSSITNQRIKEASLMFNTWSSFSQSHAREYLTTVTGQSGSAIGFCGHELIHGGGMPLAGSRTSLFVNLSFGTRTICRKVISALI